jgi:hypothetical protein
MQFSKCWDSCEIPAKLFYKIIDNNDQNLLVIKGNPSKDLIFESWQKIYDEFFKLKNDGKLKLVLKAQLQIIKLEFQIKTIKNILYALSVTPFTKKERIEIIKSINTIGTNFDLKKYESLSGEESYIFLKQEILRTYKFVLPGINNKLKLERGNYDNLTEKKEIISSFADNCVNIENALGRAIDDNMTLEKYLSYEKSVIKLSKKNE